MAMKNAFRGQIEINTKCLWIWIQIEFTTVSHPLQPIDVDYAFRNPEVKIHFLHFLVSASGSSVDRKRENIVQFFYSVLIYHIRDPKTPNSRPISTVSSFSIYSIRVNWGSIEPFIFKWAL